VEDLLLRILPDGLQEEMPSVINIFWVGFGNGEELREFGEIAKNLTSDRKCWYDKIKFTAIELSQDLPSANQDALSGLGNLIFVASGLGQLFPELEKLQRITSDGN